MQPFLLIPGGAQLGLEDQIQIGIFTIISIVCTLVPIVFIFGGRNFIPCWPALSWQVWKIGITTLISIVDTLIAIVF